MMIYAAFFKSLVVLLAGALQAMVPGYSRPGLFFSVTVPDEFRRTSLARKILRQYRFRVFVCTILAEALVFSSLLEDSPWPLVLSGLALIGGTLAAYALGRSQSRRHATVPPAERTASLSPRTDGMPGGILGIAGALLPLAAAGLYLRAHWDAAPDPLALSLNLVTGAGMDLMLILLALAIFYGSRRGSAIRALNLIILVAFMWVTSMMSAAMTILPLMISSTSTIWRALPFAMLACTAVIFTWGIRKASHLRDGSDATPDECWKFGQFYYNPQDPAFLVERRFGLGYSPNFARPISWVVIGITVVMPVAVLFEIGSL